MMHKTQIGLLPILLSVSIIAGIVSLREKYDVFVLAFNILIAVYIWSVVVIITIKEWK